MIAQAVVHTTGINWESIGTLAIAFCVAVGTGIGFVLKRLDRNRARTERFVTEKVEQVATVLEVRLGSIQEHLVSQDSKIGDTRDRVLRIEGKLNGHA